MWYHDTVAFAFDRKETNIQLLAKRGKTLCRSSSFMRLQMELIIPDVVIKEFVVI